MERLILNGNTVDNQLQLADTIKLLIYKEDPAFFELLDFENDDIFLEPFLFSYFSLEEEKPTGLRQLLYGYVEEAKRPSSIIVYTDKAGIAYIPTLGYFKTTLPNDLLTLETNGTEYVLRKEDSIVVFDFEPARFLGDSQIELVLHNHPLLYRFFQEYNRGEILNEVVEVASTAKDFELSLEKALMLIKEHLPLFYKELTLTNRKVFLHDNTKVINFTAQSIHGLLFFNTLPYNDEIYFIEEFIHQGAHNHFNMLLKDKATYFTINPEEVSLGVYTKNPKEYRSVYSAFHGLYTVTKRVDCFEVLYGKEFFSGKQKHELMGRFTDQFKRFRTGLERFDIRQICTEAGAKLFQQMHDTGLAQLERRAYLQFIFDLSNRDIDFRYKDFCDLNPLDKFQEIESKYPLNIPEGAKA